MTDARSLIARLIRDSALSLAKAARATGDRATWSPMDRGRTVLNQVVECGGLNFLSARIIEEGRMPPFDPASLQKLYTENDTLEKGLALLAQSTERLARAIEECPAERLDDTVTLPFGGGIEKTLAEVALLCQWNMNYHEGQINYIQTLCAE